MLPMTNQDTTKSARRRILSSNVRVDVDVVKGSGDKQTSNAMTRRASAYIRRSGAASSGSRYHSSNKKHSKKLASICLAASILILMGVTLVLIRVFGNGDNVSQGSKVVQVNPDILGRAQVEVTREDFGLGHFYGQFDFDMSGKKVLMSSFVNSVLLLVNVASL